MGKASEMRLQGRLPAAITGSLLYCGWEALVRTLKGRLETSRGKDLFLEMK